MATETEEMPAAEVLVENTTTTNASKHPQNVMIVSKAEAMNPSWRATMEDRCVIHDAGEWGAPDKDLLYFGIYDGHGGREMVDFLEHGLSHHVAQELSVVDDSIDMETRLVRAFLMADIHSVKAGVKSSGATVATCLVKRHPGNPFRVDLTAANAGDSRIVLGHGGKATRLTHDHKVTDPLEVARIQGAGGFIYRGRVLGVLALTRSLGDHLLKRFIIAHPHVQQQTLDLSLSSAEKPSFLILACDGLFDVLSDEAAVDLVQNFDGEKCDVANHLVEEALRRGTTDNVSAIVVWL